MSKFGHVIAKEQTQSTATIKKATAEMKTVELFYGWKAVEDVVKKLWPGLDWNIVCNHKMSIFEFFMKRGKRRFEHQLIIDKADC